MPLSFRAFPIMNALVLACAFASTSVAHASGPRLIVQFRDDDVEAAFSPVTRVAKMARESGVEGRYVRRMANAAHLVELPAGTDARTAAKDAMARGGAKLAIPDRHVKPALVPNDTYAPQQWYLANTDVAVSAYGAWNGRKDVDVVVVGGAQRAEDRVVLDLSGSPDRVRFVGHTDDETLCALYNRAACFVYPSSCEGFGIPVLEALAAGCPLCLSDIPVFHEIAGDLGAYFDPDSVEAAGKAFEQALALRKNAAFASLSAARADAFSWKTCTDKVWEIYKELA